tara:strand:- start:323 stop:1069 length:747 start_codon:yes stop_codon:yes gene_type:complete
MKDKVFHGECNGVMQGMADESIDLTVTSPPYDNMRTYKGYDFDFEIIAEELFRITKQGGIVVWVVGDATIKGSETGTSFRQALYFKELGFNLHDTMIYEKAQSPFGSNLCYLQSFEYMFIFSKGRPKTLNLIRDRKNKRSGVESVAAGGLSVDGIKQERKHKELKEYGRRKNIWKYGVGGSKIDHPAIFPEQLAKDHILSWSNEGDIVFDPMCGSGTTLLMAKQNNRHYIGIDIAEEYVELSRKRLLE